MTKYQLVPYIVRVHVRGMPSETRPLDDLDADGLDLSSELNGLLLAHVGLSVEQPDSKAVRPHRVRLASVGHDLRTLNFVVAAGRSGVTSDIVRPDGSTISRKFEDDEYVPLRHYLVYGSNRHEGILLAERVGGNGAITALRALITQNWSKRHEDLALTIAPAMDEALWNKVLAKRPVTKYRVTRPVVEGKLGVGKKPAIFSMDARPAGRGERWSLKSSRRRAKKAELPLKQVILEEFAPILAPGYETPADGAESLIDEGWSVAVELELENGKRPLVNVESDAAVTVTFPVIEDNEEPSSLPTTDDVLQAVKRLVSQGVFKRNGVRKESATPLQWKTEASEYDGTEWEVTWTIVNEHGKGLAAE